MNILGENVQEFGKIYLRGKNGFHAQTHFFFRLSIGTPVFTDARDGIKDGIFANVEKN